MASRLPALTFLADAKPPRSQLHRKGPYPAERQLATLPRFETLARVPSGPLRSRQSENVDPVPPSNAQQAKRSQASDRSEQSQSTRPVYRRHGDYPAASQSPSSELQTPIPHTEPSAGCPR